MNFSSRRFARFCQRGIPGNGRVANTIREAGADPGVGANDLLTDVAYRWWQRFRLSCPLELAIPDGQCLDLEFQQVPADSTHDAGTTTEGRRLRIPASSWRSMYATPDARHRLSTRMFLASAFAEFEVAGRFRLRKQKPWGGEECSHITATGAVATVFPPTALCTTSSLPAKVSPVAPRTSNLHTIALRSSTQLDVGDALLYVGQ